MSGRSRDIGRKYASGSAKRKCKTNRMKIKRWHRKSLNFLSFFMYLDKQLLKLKQASKTLAQTEVAETRQQDQSSLEIAENNEVLSRDIFRKSCNTNEQQEKNVSSEVTNFKTYSNDFGE